MKFQTERSQGEEITITVATIGSLAVDWGDGVRESVKPGKITGVLKGTQVTVYGDFPSWPRRVELWRENHQFWFSHVTAIPESGRQCPDFVRDCLIEECRFRTLCSTC